MRNQDLVCLGFVRTTNSFFKHTKNKRASFCEMKNLNVVPEQLLSKRGAGVKEEEK